MNTLLSNHSQQLHTQTSKEGTSAVPSVNCNFCRQHQYMHLSILSIMAQHEFTLQNKHRSELVQPRSSTTLPVCAAHRESPRENVRSTSEQHIKRSVGNHIRRFQEIGIMINKQSQEAMQDCLLGNIGWDAYWGGAIATRDASTVDVRQPQRASIGQVFPCYYGTTATPPGIEVFGKGNYVITTWGCNVAKHIWSWTTAQVYLHSESSCWFIEYCSLLPIDL